MHIVYFKHYLVRFIFLGVIGLFILSAPITHAETRVSRDITYNTLWDASSSPYILENTINVLQGSMLTVEPGVTITTDSISDILPELSVQGSLIMNGTEEKPITIKNIYDIFVNNGTTTMKHVNYMTPGPLYLHYSSADISYSSFSGAGQAINIKSGVTRIASSTIIGNNYGIYMDNYVPVLMKANPPSFLDLLFGFITPQALAQTVTPIVTVTNSSFPKTDSVAVSNYNPKTGTIFNAIDNWWGSVEGPLSSNFISSRIVGQVNYAPWLDHEPDVREHENKLCCSSILFIPGIESSRLFKRNNTLWEPNRNDDVRALFLNSHGSSTDTTIYSGSPIDSAWGYSVYGSFMKFLDGLVAGGTIGSWYGYGYDWRTSIPDVVLGNERKATTTDSLIGEVTRLAKESKTGKVTIIAHSNGGLVTKYLTKVLADQGKSDLIDSIISVAVPYLGTPEAIGGILHGDDEELASGLLLKQSVARELGQNMSSAYSLLPSAGYYRKISGTSAESTTINFTSSTPATINNGSYPKSISSFADMSSFIVDSKNSRIHASSTDVSNPIQGNASLMASAGNLHNILDVFSWPSDIARYAIVGWNALTTTGITYSSAQHCGVFSNIWKCVTLPTHTQIKSNMGDGTVVAESAVDLPLETGGSQTVASVDLGVIDSGKTAHGNMLESKTTQSVIKNIIGGNAISHIPGVTLGEPDYTKEKSYIAISTHSPIQPHVYDAQGNHVGEIPGPANTEDLYHAYETNIPGSSFEMTPNSDTDYDTYIYVPDDGQKYSVVLNGTGLGGFTYDVDRMHGSEVLNHTEYAGLPVTPLTVASTTIGDSVEPLVIDVNGDGQTDITAIHDATTTMTADSYLDMLKKTCETIKGSYCKDIPKRIDTIKDQLKKGKLKHMKDNSTKIAKHIKHRDSKKLTDNDRTEVGKMIDEFVGQFE